jgi:carbon starvation protein
MIAYMFFLAVLSLILGYLFYGKFLKNFFNLDNSRRTPAHTMRDGIDYVPAHPAVVFGHHFASIAGAGPIVGPILAASIWGWFPAYLWILIGSIFFGGVHDYSALVASLRHKGRSIGELISQYINLRAKRVFLIFTWLALVLVIAVFLELAAITMSNDPSVALSAVSFIVIAVLFGFSNYRLSIPLKFLTVLSLSLMLLVVIFSTQSQWVMHNFSFSVSTWRLILIFYILLASVLPVWILLQPRDYLSSWLLYGSLFVGIFGMFMSYDHPVKLDAFKGVFPGAHPVWPLLFITVACAAISGFHSLVASGTTSKQIDKETDALVVGYGGMLTEGLLGMIALGTVMLAGGIVIKNGKPDALATFGVGIGQFFHFFGIPYDVGKTFGLLALNSFILTSLDTATRLARYQLEEIADFKLNRYVATVAGVFLALVLVFWKTGKVPVWKIIWPIFGSTNQLVAALALLTVAVWVKKGLNKGAKIFLYPMGFMMITTLTALLILAFQKLTVSPVLSAIAVALIALSLYLINEARKVLAS